MKKLLIFGILIISGLVIAADSPYARRIRPVTSFGSCVENEVAYDMILHKLGICTNTGFVAVATGTGVTANSTSGNIPYLSAANVYSNSPLFREDGNTLAQRNGANTQIFRIYRNYVDASNYSALELLSSNGGGSNIIRTIGAGSDSARALFITSGQELFFGAGGGSLWEIDNNGHFFVTFADNAADIGKVAGNRPRTGYFGTSVITPLFKAADGTTATPSYSFSSFANTGMYTDAGANLRFSAFGTDVASFIQPSGNIEISSTGKFTWSSGANTTSGSDTELSRTAAGIVKVTNVIQVTPLTVGTLPTCNSTNDGSYASVTDLLAVPLYGVTLTAGGSVHWPVFCDGTSWKTH